MIELQEVTYVRLGTRDIEGATRFATDVLGLEIAEFGKDAVYFKSDQREQTLCYVEGDSHDQAVAFEVGSHAELSAAASECRVSRLSVVRLAVVRIRSNCLPSPVGELKGLCEKAGAHRL